MSKTSIRLQQSDSLSVMMHENDPIRDEYNRTDDETNLSLAEIMPTSLPKNSSLNNDKDSEKPDDTKLKEKTPTISKNQVKTDENDGSSNSRISSTPGQQLPLSKPSEIDNDDDRSLKAKSCFTTANMTQQQSSLKSSTQSSKTTPTNNPTDDDEDDDGGINPKKIMKQKQKAEEKKRRKDDLKKKKKSTITEDFLDEDEDGAMLKHKHKVKETKTKKNSMFVQCFQDRGDVGNLSKQKASVAEKKKTIEDSDDDDDDSDGGPKRKKFIQKKTSNKSNISKKDEVDDEDEDGGRVPIVKTYDTVKMIIPSKQPKLDNLNGTDNTSSDNTVDGTIKSFKQKKDKTLTSIDIDDQKASEIFDKSLSTKCKKTTGKHHSRTVSKEEKDAVRTTVTDSSPSNCQSSFDNKRYFLRSISYCEAQQHSITVGSEQGITSSLHSQNNTNDHNSHTSEIRNGSIRSCINNPLHSIIQSIQLLSDHSNKRQTLTQENRTETFNEKERKKRRKIARTRWYLVYTLIHNPWLSMLRKKVLLEEKLRLQCSQQALASVSIEQKSVTTTNKIQSETLRMRRMRTKTTTSFDAQPPPALRLLPLPNTDNDPQTALEQPILIHSQVLNDANIQQTTKITTTIDVLPQKNAKSVMPRTQTSHNQHMQTWHIRKVQKV